MRKISDRLYDRFFGVLTLVVPLSLALSMASTSLAWGLATTPPLKDIPTLSLDKNRVTVSGVSSGGFMAVQLHVAHSSLFKGAASIAGGIWECSKGNALRSRQVCMTNPQDIVTKDHTDLAKERAARGEIDDLSNLTNSRVVIFSSPKDTVAKELGSEKLAEFYSSFIAPANITRLTNPIAAHGMPTMAYGNTCSKSGLPWLLNCNDDVAGKILSAIDPAIKSFSTRKQADPASIVYFDQIKYITSAPGMYAWGAAYIPNACRESNANCGIHVALHGCQMNPDFIDKKFIENAGYNEWAESNKLVILYPQSSVGLNNPFGCWDWFGLSGAKYATKSGVQIEGIRKLLAEFGLK